MDEHGVPGEALNLNSTGYPDHGRRGDLPLQGKIPTAEPGIEPGTSWLVVRSSDHQATRLVTLKTLPNNSLRHSRSNIINLGLEVNRPRFDPTASRMLICIVTAFRRVG
jgi:hypothetical protein